MEIFDISEKEVIGGSEEEFRRLLSIYKYTGDTRRSQIPQSVVFTTHTGSEYAIHIHVGYGVGLCKSSVAESVDGPSLQAYRNLFVRSQGVLLSSLIPVCCKSAILIDLIIIRGCVNLRFAA